jgi:uncharacterized protein
MMTVQKFFEQARDGHLSAIKCGGCGELAIPPKEFCASCQARDWKPVVLTGTGTVASYTVIRVAPSKHAGDAPYAVGVVKLTEGASIFGRILDVSFEKLAIGMPVRFRPIVVNGQTAVGFAPSTLP